MEKLILGVGTGRCGMYSLAHLLSMQNDSNISWHFGNMPIIDWYYNDEDFERICFMLENREGKFIGDVSHFLLNYIDSLLNKYGDIVKIINIKRPFSETCMSFKNFIYKMSEGSNLNLWNSLNFKDTFYNLLTNSNALYFWNLYHTFPNFDETDDINESIRFYWDYYDRMVGKIKEMNPEIVYEYDVQSLNDVYLSKKMLSWLGHDTPLYSNIYRDNPNLVGGRSWV